MKDLTKGIESLANVADGFHESSEEINEQLTERHETDMNSDNWLSKSIRPMMVIGLFTLMVFIVVADAFGKEIDLDTKITVGTLFTTALSFYFRSKQFERVAQKNAEANLKMEKLKFREERRNQRQQRRLERKATKG